MPIIYGISKFIFSPILKRAEFQEVLFYKCLVAAPNMHRHQRGAGILTGIAVRRVLKRRRTSSDNKDANMKCVSRSTGKGWLSGSIYAR